MLLAARCLEVHVSWQIKGYAGLITLVVIVLIRAAAHHFMLDKVHQLEKDLSGVWP
jgi:hypothetical protein